MHCRASNVSRLWNDRVADSSECVAMPCEACAVALQHQVWGDGNNDEAMVFSKGNVSMANNRGSECCCKGGMAPCIILHTAYTRCCRGVDKLMDCQRHMQDLRLH